MRYVNLKKRNTSKFQYQSKRLATVSVLLLALLAVVVVPLTSRANQYKVEKQNQIIDIADENLDNETIEQVNHLALDENDL